jgi:eukaryotic translation initiation factor 2C
VSILQDYFLSQYNIRLQYPDLPLVETKQDTFYPIELCDFTPGNKFNKRLSPEQTARANPIQILK